VGSLNFAPVLFVSLFGGLWAMVMLFGAYVTSRRPVLMVAGSAVLLVVVSVITLDHTRVFAVTSAPWIAVVIAFVLSQPSAISQWRTLLVVEAMAWIVPPLVLQGVDQIYVGALNSLDQWIMFLSLYMPGA